VESAEQRAPLSLLIWPSREAVRGTQSAVIKNFFQKKSRNIWWVQKKVVPLHPQNERIAIDMMVP
jgi:hypothetical protein